MCRQQTFLGALNLGQRSHETLVDCLLHRSPLLASCPGRRRATVSADDPSCNDSFRVRRSRETTERGTPMRRLIVLLALVVTAAAMSATASALTGDPRVCATLTPGGTSRHAYWCAHNAAVAAVRTTMQNQQHVARWLPGISCDQAGTLLRWRCFTFLGGDHWNLSVVFRATSAGWKRTVTVAP